MALTAKRRRFVDEYAVDGDASKAAVRAGYSARTAAQIGYELLHTPEVAAAIAAREQARAEKTGITAERIEAELGLPAFANPAEVPGLTWTDKIRALMGLARIHGMLKDRIEVDMGLADLFELVRDKARGEKAS